jgi:hypothetical protein
VLPREHLYAVLASIPLESEDADADAEVEADMAIL